MHFSFNFQAIKQTSKVRLAFHFIQLLTYIVLTFSSPRPHKDPEDLQEFTEPDCTDMEGIKPFFEGHDRFACFRKLLNLKCQVLPAFKE